ncbi:GyrI-like domain-containing protein [bacterium]|nr:MAG: GyrI-like domain-containing protein [bacterium]
MNVQVVSLAPINVVSLGHVGPYETLSPVFDRLWEWVTAQSVPVTRTIGIYWDNAEFTPTNQLRSAACVEVPLGFTLTDTGGLPLQLGSLAGGSYATVRHQGPYEGLTAAWAELTRTVERDLRRTISEEPAFEVYVNDASETAPRDLVTELYMPVL